MKNPTKFIIFFLFLPVLLRAQVATEEFASPPKQYRPVPLWFWNNATIEEDELLHQFRQMTEVDGYGGCAILPFGKSFRPEYLSEEYFRLYGKVLDAARKKGLQMSVYDEYGFPSGSMGAINGDDTPRFMNKYPELTVKRLDKVEYNVPSGTEFTCELPAEGKRMAVVAMDTVSKKRISLERYIAGNTVRWSVPAGAWKVLCFICVRDGDPNVDYLDPEAVKRFIAETHEAYYERFPEAFGSVITETFFDEPTMYRAKGRMWTDEFNQKFRQRYGFSPELLYPALWYDIGADTRSARNYLFGFRARLYSEGFMKTIQDWAGEHGILSTGHQDQEEIANPVSVSGDLMLCGKYMDVPGIDRIGGNRPTEHFYKVVSSSANNWDKQFVMSETYGDMGNISIDRMYTIAMEQYTKGINCLIPHAVWYNDGNVTFRPELSWRNDLYREHLPQFNLFLSRLNYMLRPAGRHVADIAVLYPIESMQGEHYLDGEKGFYEGGVVVPGTDYPRISSALTDTLGKDFTYVHPEVLREKCDVDGGWLCMDNKINKERFSVVIVPGMKTISPDNLQKLARFQKAGGRVLFTTRLPDKSVEMGRDARVCRLVKSMLAGGALFLPDPSAETLRKALCRTDHVYDVSFSEGRELNYIHKVCGDRSVYYFANLRPRPCAAEVVVRGHIVPRLTDPHSGKESAAAYEHKELNGVDITVIPLSLGANRSVFVVEK